MPRCARSFLLLLARRPRDLVGLTLDAILLAQPLAEIDEVTALATQRPELVAVLDRRAPADRALAGRRLHPAVPRPSAAHRASRNARLMPRSAAAPSRSPR